MNPPLTLAAAALSWGPRPGLDLVEDVSFVLEPGCKLAIIGPNGAGKTSLLRLLYGRHRPVAGQVLLDGVPLGSMSREAIARQLAVLSQSDSADGRLDVRQYVALGRTPHAGRATRAQHDDAVGRALAEVGLDHLAGRTLASLSGGERQRAGVARALAQEPGLLLLDEPTNHLDPRARADLLDLLRRVPATVVAVLHDLPLVTPFADLVAVMDRGRLIACDAPEVALGPAVVRRVFALDVVRCTHPAHGRGVLVFERPDAPLVSSS